MKLRLYSWTCSVVGLGLLACNDAQTPAENVQVSHTSAALTAEANTERALRGLIDASSHLANSRTLARVLSSFGGHSTICTSTEAVSCPSGATDCAPVDSEPSCVDQNDDVTTEDLAEVRSDLHEALDDLMRSLREEVFIDENLESDDGKTVVYKLGPKLLCGSVDESDSPPSAGSPVSADTATTTTDDTAIGEPTGDTIGGQPAYDQDCLAELEKWKPRVQLVSPRAGDIDLSLLLTDERISPITFNLYQQKLGVTVDLAKVETASKRVGSHLDGVTGLAGVYSASLVQNGSLDYTLDLSVTDMIRAILGDEPNTVSISLAPSPKALTLNVNGNTGRISGRLDLSRFALLGPLSSFMSEEDDSAPTNSTDASSTPVASPSYHGTIEGALAGIAGNFVHEQASDSLSLTNVGFGVEPSTLKFEQTTLLSIDLNAGSGRIFDLYIDGSSDMGPSLQFSPGLDADVLLGFAALADQVQDIEQFLMNDRLKISLKGNRPSLRIEEEQLRVTSGSLELTSEPYPEYHRLVDAGMCLVDAESDNHPPCIFGELASETCQ